MHSILVLLVATTTVFAGNTQLNFSTWRKFKAEHNKIYHPQEERLRYHIFSENLKNIEEHNALYKVGLTSYMKGVNQFTDLTEEEFKNIFLMTSEGPVDFSGTLGIFEKNSSDMVPESIDYRQYGAVNPIRSQGKCGSCWSFAAVASLESHNFLRTNVLLSLSEQNLLDCDVISKGCFGGLAMWAYNYIRDNGLESETDYPYTGIEATCKYSPPKSKITVKGYRLVKPKDENDLKSAVGTVGPVVVSVDATELANYRSGIFYASRSNYSLNHAVVVVGYGSESDKDYWIVRNSWGDTWGEDGYFRVARNSGNQIGIADRPVYPVL